MNILYSIIGLTFLQIILSIDNVIFLSVVTAKLEPAVRSKARKIGVIISMALNALLITFASILISKKHELFTLFEHTYDIHDLIMISGGMFLMYKAVKELYDKMEGKADVKKIENKSMLQIILTMTAIDLIFSIDSTITAVGMSDIRIVQICATLAAILTMYFFFNPINNITEKHPSFKMLSLAFLILIGFALFTNGMGIEIPKGYIYFAMSFSLGMEMINIRHKKKIKN